MAQIKRRSPGGGKKKSRGWLLLVLGLGIGIATAYLAQLVTERDLHRTVASWFKREKSAPTQAQKEPAKPKSKFDFYTILPETETVLPEREPRQAPRVAKTTPEESVNYVLQAGSFPTYEDADQLKAKLALQGLTAHIQKVTIEGKGEFHRVRLGPYEKLEELDAANQQLSKLGLKTMRLKVKKGAG
jgi:cell division protein FtsN